MDLIVRGEIITGAADSLTQVGIQDGRFVLASGSNALQLGGDAAQVIEGWALPGLVDVHCHIGLSDQGAVDDQTALAQARADARSGTLLVRDAGVPSDTRWLQGREDVPDIIRSGRHIARPKRYLRHFGRELESVDLLPHEVTAQARAADGWVKLVGDWINRARGAEADLEPLWPPDVLADAVARAHDEGARVTIHTFATETLDDVLAAGVDCIEHGTGMIAHHMQMAAARRIPVVPTLLQVNRFEQIAEQGAAKFPRFAGRMRQMYRRRYQHVRDLYDAGVPLLVGTDAGGTIAHGQIAAECAQLVHAGIPVIDVLAAATWTARDFLGRPGIAEGAPADLVVYPEDPRRDIAVLAHPTAVIRGGRIIA